MFVSNGVLHNTHLGFKLCWIPDQTPFVVPETDELAQLVLDETLRRDLIPFTTIECIRAGVPLPVFWTIVKTAAALKNNGYNWWRLDQSSKHLLASWILSHPQPKFLLAKHPVLWEIFPTMVIGSEVEARIASADGLMYCFRADAQPTRGLLYDWNVDVEMGSCTILFASSPLRVEFSILELHNSGLIGLPEFIYGVLSTHGSPVAVA